MAQQNKEDSLVKLNSTKDETEYEYVPPDGGWGWLVLGGSVLVSLLIPGTIKSFGVLFVEFQDVFNASPVVAAWIPALTYFLYCSLGPLASYLSTKYSYRTVTLLGGMFAATGMISSYFATNIAHLYICYGILVGTGAGLSFPPGVFIVTSYFVRLRGLANGIAISGSALGSIILPPFLRFLLETYGYRGAVLIMGGLILNVLVGAALYDPVQQHLKRVPVDKTKKNCKHKVIHYVENSTKNKMNGDVTRTPEEKALLDTIIYEAGEMPVEKNKDAEYFASSPITANNKNVINQPLIVVEDSSIKKTDSQLNLDQKTDGQLNLERQIASSENINQMSRKISTGSYRGRNSYLMGSLGQLPRRVSISKSVPRVASSTAVSRSRKISVTSNLSTSSFRYISTAFHGSTLVGLNPEFSSQLTMKTDDKPSCLSSVCSCFGRKTYDSTVNKETKDNVYRTLLRDPVFIIILISNASTAIGYTNFTILLPSYAISMGFTKDKASYLLSIVATLDLVGRVGGSSLSDWLPINKKFYYVGGLLLSGISLLLLPLAYDYLSLSLFCAAFGLSSGSYVGITAIIMVDLLGEDMLASSYGISLFINGILQLVGPPICNLVYEYLNSYGPIVSALGIFLILGASVWIYLPLFVNNRQKNSQILA